jgi:hypothetical protein
MAPEESPSCFTAIAFRNGEEDYDNSTSMVTAPLLQHYDDEIPMGNYEEVDKSERKSFQKSISLGAVIGFLTQVVSSGAYAIMLVHWGDTVVQKTEGDWFLYTIISVLTQIDICLYVVVWMAFACIMTRVRMAVLLDQHDTPELRRRFAFVSGVLYFLVGVVVGAFIALSMIDAYLGIPIPFLLSVATVTLDLVCCYMMICGYDIGEGCTTPKQDVMYLV